MILCNMTIPSLIIVKAMGGANRFYDKIQYNRATNNRPFQGIHG